MTVYCQNCGKDTEGRPLAFYGNMICSEECKKLLSERVYFRDDPPEPGSTWFCPHCAAKNPLGDPREELRPNCTSCGKPLDPGSATPPKKGGCMALVLLALCLGGMIGCFGSGQTVRRSVTGMAVDPDPAPMSVGSAPLADMVPPPSEPDSDEVHYLYDAKFEPPAGRIIHGMGQWELGNVEYLRMLGSRSISPASELQFFAIGDWPRAWETRINKFAEHIRGERAVGRIPHVEISLFGIRYVEHGEESIDHEIAQTHVHDERIRELARTIRDVGGPVFVRIGGEFNGAWFDYHPYEYPKAYRRIVEMFRQEKADNVAFVWCYEPSAPSDFDVVDEHGPRWFPGEDVIDWFGLDVFDISGFAGGRGRSGLESKMDRSLKFLRMAERYGKPVIIAESSAAKQMITADLGKGRRVWDEWFAPFFRFLEQHPNIEAFHYVNTDWRTSGDAVANGWQDASINRNAYLSRRYVAEMRKPRYLHVDDVHLLNGYEAAMQIGLGPDTEPDTEPAADEPPVDGPAPRGGR